MPETEACAVAIVDDSSLSATGKLAAALDRADLWNALRRTQAGRSPDQIRIVIKPEFAGFAVGSPTATDPALVEHLIDQLHDRGFTNTVVAGTADSSALWAENRDLYALSDLLGYRYTTPTGRSYDIVDLAGTLDETAFPIESVLHGCAISRDWLDADMRIVFSKSRTDEVSGYALCLDTLIGVLPLIDKDLHYRKRRHPGDVVAALLGAAPVQFCLIDAIVAAHGAGGRRAPAAIDTDTIIAATDIVLADYVGALKMGLDPNVSPTFARSLRTHPLPERYIVAGSLGSLSQLGERSRAVAARGGNAQPGRDTRSPGRAVAAAPRPGAVSAQASARRAAQRGIGGVLCRFRRQSDSQWLLMLANALLAWIDAAVGSYRTLFDKDALRRHSVPLGLDLNAIPEGAFDALVDELRRLEPVAAAAPQVSERAWLAVRR